MENRTAYAYVQQKHHVYLTETSPRPVRDAALENDIVIHEYTHGLNNRLVGGGTARCLTGLDEGMADAIADWFSLSTSQVAADFIAGI